MPDEFTYERSWDDIHAMLDRAERKQNAHLTGMQRDKASKEQRIKHMRNYKALEGVIKSLRWVLGDRQIEHPLGVIGMDDYTIDLLDEIAALRASINRAHFWISNFKTDLAFDVLDKALSVWVEEEE